jgi:fatty acid-binding protein DegV
MSRFEFMYNNEIDGLRQNMLGVSPVGADANQSKAATLDALRSIQKLQTKQVTQSLNAADVHTLVGLLANPDTHEFDNLVVNMLIGVDDALLDGVSLELLQIIADELGGDPRIDSAFLQQLISRLDVVIKNSPNREALSKALHTIIHRKASETVDATDTQAIIQAIRDDMRELEALQQITITQGLGELSQGVGIADMPAPTVIPSTTTDGVGGLNVWQLAGLDGTDELVFAPKADRVINKEKGIAIEFGPDKSVIADITLNADDRIVGYAKAHGVAGEVEPVELDSQFITAIVQIGRIQPLLLISEIATQWIVQMNQKANVKTPPFPVAIVTDNVVSLRDIDPVEYIRTVPESDHPQYAIYEIYKELYDEGYHTIISLHLNPNLKKSYAAAKAAKQQIDRQNPEDLDIYVHNTNANGVGLGLMIYELVSAIKIQVPPLEVNQLAERLVKSYRHWVCPLDSDFLKNHSWAMNLADTQKKVQMRLFHFTPVIELDRKLTIISVSSSKEAALSVLVSLIEKRVQSSRRPITRIGVEYRGVFRDAIRIRNQIGAMYPNITVTLQSVGQLTTQFFGAELVGICVI